MSSISIAPFLFEIGHLAHTPRSGYALLGVEGQNVAEHSHRVALVAYALAKLDGAADMFRVLLMAVCHDLPETRTSDLNALSKRYLRIDLAQILADQCGPLPFGDEIRELVEEYEASSTHEALIVRDADNIELLLALREREAMGGETIKTWESDVLDRLKTPIAKQLAQAIMQSDPNDWWMRQTDDPA